MAFLCGQPAAIDFALNAAHRVGVGMRVPGPETKMPARRGAGWVLTPLMSARRFVDNWCIRSGIILHVGLELYPIGYTL